MTTRERIEDFLRCIEEGTGRKLPRHPWNPDDPDDCPVCKALGMKNGPEEGVVDLGAVKVLTARVPRQPTVRLPLARRPARRPKRP